MVLDIIHRNSPIPIYHQLKEILLKKIRTGEWLQARLSPQSVSCAKPMALAE